MVSDDITVITTDYNDYYVIHVLRLDLDQS